MTIADNALTLMNNVQSLAATGNVNLRGIIAELRAMLQNVYVLHANEINANVPDVSVADIPALISEVEGYLQGVLDDSAAIESMISGGSAQAIAKIEQIMAGLVPADAPTALADIQLDFSSAIPAERALAESERKRAEVAILSNAAARGFFLPPGEAVGAIAEVRAKTAEAMGKRAAEVRRAQQEQNARLFLDRLEKQYAMQEQLIRAWVQTYELTTRLIGQVIADYEKSPLLDAQIAAETASSLTSAYAGLNSAAIQLTRAAGTTYKAQLSGHKLQVLEDQLKALAYKKGMTLTFNERGKVASALSAALNNAGSVASGCIGSTTANGNYVERSFA